MKETEICIYYVLQLQWRSKTRQFTENYCVHNSNSTAGNSKHEAMGADYNTDDNVNVTDSGGDAECMREQNTIHPEFHWCSGTSDIQYSFIANKGLGRDFLFLPVTSYSI